MATFLTYPEFARFQMEDPHQVRIQEGNNEPDFHTCEFCSRHAEETAQDDHIALNVVNPFVDQEARILNLRRPRRGQRTTISFTDNSSAGIPSAEEIVTALVMGGKGLADNSVSIPHVRFMEVLSLLRKHLKEKQTTEEDVIQRGRPSQHTSMLPFRRSISIP